eukprot:NODE_90_length_21577_cov_0.697691.p9 type:complete len:353 gc:universal NODE_90_length_21577_cov_0.697691:1116-58(-)
MNCTGQELILDLLEVLSQSRKLQISFSDLLVLLNYDEDKTISVLNEHQSLVPIICKLHGMDSSYILKKFPKNSSNDSIIIPNQNYKKQSYFDEIYNLSLKSRLYLQNDQILDKKILKEFQNINPFRIQIENCLESTDLEHNMNCFSELIRKRKPAEIMEFVNTEYTERKVDVLNLFTLTLLRSIGWKCHSLETIYPENLEALLKALQILLKNGFPSLQDSIKYSLINNTFGTYATYYVLLTFFLHNIKTEDPFEKQLEGQINGDTWVHKVLALNQEYSQANCDSVFESLYAEGIKIPISMASRYIYEFKQDSYYFGLHPRYALLNKNYLFPKIEASILEELQNLLLSQLNKN